MGAKASLVVFGDLWAALWNGGEPDRSAAEAVIRALHPEYEVEPAADSTLADETFPRHPDHAYVAVLPEATIVCDRTIEEDAVLDFAAGRPVVVFQRDSDSFSFTEWWDGCEVRTEEDQDGTADDVAAQIFGLAGQSELEGVVMHGFRLIHPRQAEIEAAVARFSRSAGFTAQRPTTTP
ncbi:MAG: hypothetical protein QOF58_2423 [Pseudonocardiales bacterium]|jgi:hypothetical protein|nr:hypothetical protein [Pseudonocardiales bacterium]